jgi:hypothetical protein
MLLCIPLALCMISVMNKTIYLTNMKYDESYEHRQPYTHYFTVVICNLVCSETLNLCWHAETLDDYLGGWGSDLGTSTGTSVLPLSPEETCEAHPLH